MENTDPSSSPPDPPTRKRWFRFSISTLLLVSVIVALSVSHWTSARDRLALERKLDQIRRDHDLLEISDPNKIHVLPMESSFSNMGQFRVHLPEGKRYLLNFEWQDDLGKKKPPAQYPSKPLMAGNYLIEYVIRYVPKQGSGRWVVCISARSQGRAESMHFPFPWQAPHWLDEEFVGNADYRLLGLDPRTTINRRTAEAGRITIGKENILEDRRVHLFEEDDVVTLIQYRVTSEVQLGTLIKDVTSSDEVFRIWIEEELQQP